MRIQKNRQVIFEIAEFVGDWPIRDDGTVTCREWGTSPPVYFYEPPPAFLSNGGRPNNDIAWFVTLGSFPYDAVTGTWGPYTNGYFDLKSIAEGGEAYVAMNVRFDIVEQNEPFYVGFAFHLWVDPGMVTTIVKITRTSTKSWYIETLPPDHPLAVLRGMQADQANLFMVASSERRGHGGGNCDLGDWLMPFAMTVTDLTK
jgi:hypothetical protein